MANILLVDDSESIRALLGAALTEAGHVVATAVDGHEAQRLCGRLRFDLIVTDIYMPEADGLELIGAVSRLRPRPPVIAMSSAGGLMDMLPIASRFGAHAVLRKPFPPAELIAAVAAALHEPAAGSVRPTTAAGRPAHRAGAVNL